MKHTKGLVIRDRLRLIGAILFCWLYIPAMISFLCCNNRDLVKSDLLRKKRHISISMPTVISLLYFLHHDRYYRSLFYFRIGPAWSFMISWIRPGDRYFILSKSMKIGRECGVLHPYSTVLNAESIGDHFTCLHCTTIGSKDRNLRPVIGNYVTLGANVTIIGDVNIGNHVTVGAGSVVVKDVPDNCVVAGNPAKVIQKLTE